MIFLGEKITFSFAAAFVLILGGMFLILKPGRPRERNFSLHSLKQLRK
jgi:drug/metabolite transporter (DMT)-like permease